MLSLFKDKIIVDNVKYTIKKQIGEGAFSYVYRAKNDKKVEFAIKKTICQTEEQKAMALREISIINQIEHENVVHIMGSSITSNHTHKCDEVYAVMYFYEMGTLQHVIDSGNIFTCKSGLITNVDGFAKRSKLLQNSIGNILMGCVNGLLAVHDAGYRHAGMILPLCC